MPPAMSDDGLTDLSSLSSLSPAPESDGEVQLRADRGILKFFHKAPKGKTTIKLINKNKGTPAAHSGSDASASAAAAATTPKSKRKTAGKKKGGATGGTGANGDSDSDEGASRRVREPSPPHEYTLADNPDIAFVVMFRNRFAECFSKNLVSFGPQELESDIVDATPGRRVEYFVCALLKLLLNRQQDVKPDHYNRALEEAVQTHKAQWLTSWDESPLANSKTFHLMTPSERLSMLRALVLWTMSSSKVVRDVIDSKYKGKRKEDDSNIAYSVQPWGNDSDKRRYYLVEGVDDTAFRVYRESNPAGLSNRTWWSVASTIDEIRELVEKLETQDGGQRARKLAKRLNDEIPRFEATEEKRRRREYRQQQRDRFKRPEPGVSVYEGRTRGKRIKYTYSDDEDFWTESSVGVRRSGRNTGGTQTPAEPVTTASGRQIRAPSRLNGGLSASASIHGDLDSAAGEGEMADVESTAELGLGPNGRPRRAAAVNHGTNGWAKPKPKEYEYDSQADESEEPSEPDLGDDEEDDVSFDEDDDADDDAMDVDVDVDVEHEQEHEHVHDDGPGLGSDKTQSTLASVASVASTASDAKTLVDKVVIDELPKAEMQDNAPGTPGKENGLPTAALAFRGSPEKTHQAKMPQIY